MIGRRRPACARRTRPAAAACRRADRTDRSVARKCVRRRSAGDDRARHVVDVHRLEAGAGRSQHDHRQQPREVREQVEEMVLAPEDHRRPQDGGWKALALGRQDQLLGLAFGAQIRAGAVRDRPGARSRAPGAAPRAGGRPSMIWRGSSTWTRWKSPCRMPTRLMTASACSTRRSQGGRIVHVGLHHVHGRQQDQVLGALAVARRHAHVQAARHQLPDYMPAQKARAAEHQNGAKDHTESPSYSGPSSCALERRTVHSLVVERPRADRPRRCLSVTTVCPNRRE